MRSRRCCLSVPASPARKLGKAPALAVDEIVIDLEDSVPPDQKPEARAAVVDALAAGGPWEAATVAVRVNGAGTPWFEDDMRALTGAGARLDSVIVPKVESPADLERAADLAPVALQVVIETAKSLRDVDAIAEADAPLEALILGPADMSVALGFASPDEGSRWDFVRGAILVAARAAGIQAIDGPFLKIADLDGLRASAQRACEFGFDGKWALHPDQIEPITKAFTPRAEDIERAQAIRDALDGAAEGAVMLDGEMLDEASLKRADAILARVGAPETPTG